MTRPDRRAAWLAFLIVVPILLLASCRKAPDGGLVHASGHVEATEVRLAAKIGGRLAELPYREGDAVKEGEKVARIDTTDAEIERQRTEAELAGADARLRLLLAGTRLEDVERAEAEVARTEADLQNARTEEQRMDGLSARGTATIKARDDARTRALMLFRSLAGQKAELHKLRAGARPEEIDAARAQKQGAEAALAAVKQRIADATVVAPRPGVITQRTTEPGEVLPAGAVVSVLTDVAHPWLNAYVEEPVLSRIKLGDKVKVRADGRAQEFTGTITYVSEVAEFTPKNVQTPEERAKLVFRVKVGLDNAAGVFKPGMPADAYFQPTAR